MCTSWQRQHQIKLKIWHKRGFLALMVFIMSWFLSHQRFVLHVTALISGVQHLCVFVCVLPGLSSAAPALIVSVQLWCESRTPAGRACWAATQTRWAKHPSKSLLDSANECGAQTIHPNPTAHLSATAVQEPEEVNYRQLSVCAPWPWKCG